MNDTTDDLLDDLALLDEGTDTLESTIQSTRPPQSGSANTIDSASLSLEAAKASQAAATESQKAAEAAIKLSHEFKAQIIELTDSNMAWRQAARQTTNELNSNRGKMSIMMVISIIMALITTGMTGWLYYFMIKQQEQYKGEVLDLIQTEEGLYNKKITLKVDQLSSMIEMLSADVQSLSPNKIVRSHKKVATHPTQPALEIIPTEDISPLPHTPEAAPLKGNGAHPSQTPHSTHEQTPEAGHHTPNHDTAPMHATPKHSTPHSTEDVQTRVTLEHYQVLKTLVESILAKQQDMQASLMSYQAMMQTKSAHPTHKPSAPHHSTKLTDKESKKLASISWLVRQQGKTLRAIQAKLEHQQAPANTASSHNDLKGIQASLEGLKSQINQLSEQQKSIRNEVQALKMETAILSAQPKPYSYRQPK